MPEHHVWSVTSFEYDDTFFRCNHCDARTNCRRGFPSPMQGGPCPGLPGENTDPVQEFVTSTPVPSKYSLLKVDPFEAKDS